MTRVLFDQFDAMGSTVDVVVVGTDIELLDRARHRIAHLERRWSRFLADSDITRINTAAGRPVQVHGDTLTLLEEMHAGLIATEGAFDPTLLAALVDQGYGASRVDERRRTSVPVDALRRGSFDEIVLDRDAHTVLAPAGTCLDPGGIGKGLAADLTVDQLLHEGARGALVSVGGDLRVVGEAPQQGGWAVDVRDARNEHCVTAQLRLVEGGVATSGIRRRHWVVPDGSHRHHLLDPETGEPAQSTCRADPGAIAEVSVVAGTAAWAEVWTKFVFVAGVAKGLARLDAIGLPARAVLATDVAVVNDCWATVAVPTDDRVAS